MAEKKDELGRFESRLALLDWASKAFPLVGAAMAGVIAAVTDFMAAWAPLSWFVSAALMWLVFLVAQLALSAKRERDERVRRIQMLEAPKGQINPLDERYVRQRIYISDLLPPIGLVIRDKEFRDCDIIGPANIVFDTDAGGRSELINATFSLCDGVITNDEVAVQNVVAFQNCSFRNCRFYKVTLLMPLGAYLHFLPEMRGMNWINDALIPPEALNART